MAKTAVAGLDMKLVEIAMVYQRSRVLCAAARLGVADALKEGERSVQEIAGSCAADAATLLGASPNCLALHVPLLTRGVHKSTTKSMKIGELFQQHVHEILQSSQTMALHLKTKHG